MEVVFWAGYLFSLKSRPTISPLSSFSSTSLISKQVVSNRLQNHINQVLRKAETPERKKERKEEKMATLLRFSRKTLALKPSPSLFLSRLHFSTADPKPVVTPDPDRVKWDYRGQRRIIPLGQWLPKIAVDAYVAPNVVLAGQVTVYDGSSVWNGAVLRGDLNKITVGFCSNVQERCVLHAAWSSPTG